ncbi:MAG: metal-dependent hydrolase [Magnetococcales bacterium]|nr:metal-dependent hydrolase [Magnetococcales bacterium]
MANFKVHCITAAVAGGVVGTLLLKEHLLEPYGVITGFFLTTLGGLLPDVDADNSTLLATFLTIVAVILSFLVMFSQSQQRTGMELILLWLGCYLFCKWVVFALITQLTTHRGIFHSLPAALLASLATVMLLYHLFGWSNRSSWLGGGFLGLGYLLHLLLDEFASLNPFGITGIRHSLGSALKLRSQDLLPTLVVYLAIAGIFPFLPEGIGVWRDFLRIGIWSGMGSG